MKKLIILLSLLFAAFSCKNEKKNYTTIEAEYIFVSDAAVLKGKNFIYGVVLDEKASELSKKVEPMKKDQYDMVPVVVNGIIKENPNKEGWEKIVEIKEIVEVLPVAKETGNESIKIDVTQ